MAGNTGFNFRYNLAGRTSGIQRQWIIADSQTITVGDMVELNSGYVALVGAGSPIMGVVIGLVDKNGINMDNSKLAIAGTSASYTSSTKTTVAGSDNTTTDYLKAVVDIDPFSVWSGATDNASTDTQASLAGCYTDLVAGSDQADDDTAAVTLAQLFIWGADPENSAYNLYSIAEHQLWNAPT